MVLRRKEITKRGFMNTVFLKWHLRARSNRMSLPAAVLAIALPMVACIALAQDTEVKTTKMTTPAGYAAHYSVDAGGRISNLVGSDAMYDTLVNLQAGPRVNGETIFLHRLDSNKHGLVDDARVTGSSFGGDPYNFAKLSMSKARLYEFDGIFRRDRQYFDYDLLGNPNLPSGLNVPIGKTTAPTGYLAWPQPQHSSVMTNSVRRMTDTDLRVYPLSKLSVHFGYSHNIFQGPSLLPVRSAAMFGYNSLMEEDQRHLTDEYSMSLDWKPVREPVELRAAHPPLQGEQLHHAGPQWVPGAGSRRHAGLPGQLGCIEQWIDFYHARSGRRTAPPPAIATASPTPTTFSVPFAERRQADHRSVLRGGHRLSCARIRIRTIMPSEILRFQSSSIKNLSMNGEFSYSRMNMNMPNFFENASGLNGTTRDEYYSAVGTGKREVYSAAIWHCLASDQQLRSRRSGTLSANGQPGSVNTSGYTKLVTGTAAGQETINFTGTLTSSVTNSGVATGEVYGPVYTYFGNEQLVNNLTASWTVTPKANLAFTYRYGNRNIGLNLNVTSATTRTIFAITEQGAILNGSYRITTTGTSTARLKQCTTTTRLPPCRRASCATIVCTPRSPGEMGDHFSCLHRHGAAQQHQ